MKVNIEFISKKCSRVDEVCMKREEMKRTSFSTIRVFLCDYFKTERA